MLLGVSGVVAASSRIVVSSPWEFAESPCDFFSQLPRHQRHKPRADTRQRHTHLVTMGVGTTATSSSRFFKSSLYHSSFSYGNKSVELWTTTCIVTNFGSSSRCRSLINPSNAHLSGTANLSYFPRGGGPVPHSFDREPTLFQTSSTWGGMEVGKDMLFPASVVDGLVHLHAGRQLQKEIAWLLLQRNKATDELCPVGSAVQTTGGNLDYETILHTTPPFYNDKDSDHKLKQCYHAALGLVTDDQRVASPLLGAGARGFPRDVAITLACSAVSEWMKQEGRGTIVFGLLEEALVEDMAREFSSAL